MRIKLFEEFSEWDRDEFLFDLYAMSSTEVEELFFAEIKSKTPHIEKIEVMIKSGLVDVKATDNWRQTPLHWASANNAIETAKLLLERGADLEAENKWGQTPLHVASRYNHIKMTKLFLDAGADLEAKNNRGETPLHLASSMNSIEIAKLLIERGADVKAKDDDGETPLHFAQSDEMRALLSGGGL